MGVVRVEIELSEWENIDNLRNRAGIGHLPYSSLDNGNYVFIAYGEPSSLKYILQNAIGDGGKVLGTVD